MLRKSKNSACSFLRKLISPYGYGSKDAFGYRRPTNKALLNDYNRKGYIRGLTNAQMSDHFLGKSTFYFWADGRIKTPTALVCIDIDNHKIGTLDAALAFAQHLKDRFFPGVYYEPSTGGKGVHGYLLIDKQGFGDERLHGVCKMLDRTLKAIHRRWQAQNPDQVVEGVEIKGHPPRITWSWDGQMNDLISGQFAKLPREMLSRFEEFKKTTVLDARLISQLSLQYKDEPIVLDAPAALPSKPSSSLTGCVVKKSNLDQFDAYRNIARKIVTSPLRTTGREVATAEDMAVLLLILEACTNDMNADGSMPTARIRENWEILLANGDVKRSWCPRRYTTLRDRLSELDNIDWEDAHYLPGSMSPDGKGQAARWKASESLMDLIETEKRGLQVGKAVVEAEMSGVEFVTEGVVSGIREREEDLYCDKILFLPSDEPKPSWFIGLRQYNYVRPLLDVGAGRLKMAA